MTSSKDVPIDNCVKLSVTKGDLHLEVTYSPKVESFEGREDSGPLQCLIHDSY